MKKVLVTGGAGYVGSILIPKLLDKGYYVRCFDNMMYKTPSLQTSCIDKKFEFVRGDIRNHVAVRDAVKDMDYIIHLAAIVGFPACRRNERLAREVNYLGTVNIENVRDYDKQKIVYASTGSVYGAIHKAIGENVDAVCTEDYPPKPLTWYGKTKLEAEQEVMVHNNSVAFRFATAFGLSPRLRLDLMPNDFTYQAVKNKMLVLYEKGFKRTFIHVRDLADSYLFAIENFDKIKGEVYNIGSEKMNYTKWDVANLIRKYVDYDIILSGKGSDPDKRDYTVSYEKIRKKGFETKISMEEGIQEMVRGIDMIEIVNPYSNA